MTLKTINGVQRHMEDQPLDLIYDGIDPDDRLRTAFKLAHDPATDYQYMISAGTEGFDAAAMTAGMKFQAEVSKVRYVARILQVYPAATP